MSGVHVRFRVGEELYALPVENVREVADVGQVAPVPGAPASVLGVRNLRGLVLPIVDLAAVVGIERTAEAPRLLIVEGYGRRAGLAIDDVTDVGELAGAVQDTDMEFLSGSTLADGELVGVVDLEALFVAVERKPA